jgi:signal transduction histidine kinase
VVAGLFVGLLVVAFGAALAGTGLTEGGPYLALLMLPIVVAGLLLARRWLLLTAIASYAAAILAVNADTTLAAQGITPPTGNILFATIFVTVAVDQFGGTVRRALFEAIAHEQVIESGRQQLAERTTELQTVVDRLEQEIAERQRLEQERADIQARGMESQRLESVGLLAGGVAHDFNNLLTAISGYTDLARTRFGPDDEVQEELGGIRHAAEQAASLTRQLLAFSRNQPLRPSIVDLATVVRNVEPLLRRLLGERIHLVAETAPDVWPVLVDASQIESIIVNLAINARDAMESGGTLTIETSNIELDNEYVRTHPEVIPGEYAMLAVSDTGDGMDEETLSHIFEPFFTTKAFGKGTGLGLATVYGTVRQSGGHIWVYSEPRQGTTFKVYLPRAAGPSPELAAITARAEARGGSELVLVAEDEDYVRAMIVQALERRGYEVLAVESGEAALEALADRGAAVGVLLSDMVMPGIGGLELVEQARALRPDLRAIVMSGYTATQMDQRQLPADVTFLEKPFTLARLDEAIREVLET